MADPFVAEVRIFPFTFSPKGWAFCDGQLMPISQNSALFSLLGTTYGGDGKSTFALPNFQGSAVAHPDGDQIYSGSTGGSQTVTLQQGEMPAHSHSFTISTEAAVSKGPQGLYFAKGAGVGMYAPGNVNVGQMNPAFLAPAGGNAPHNNMQPYLTLNYNIALQGVFPPRP